MDAGRGSRGTASDEDYEDGLYTDYSHNGEVEDEHGTYPYGIRRYLHDHQSPLHRFRLHLASFSDSERYAPVPGQMPSWRIQDGVESTHPLRRLRPSRASDIEHQARRRQSTSTVHSSPSHQQSVSSRSPSLVSLHPARSSDPDSREPPSSYQTTTTAPYQPPPENVAADELAGPDHGGDHAGGHGGGPGIDGPDMSMSEATTAGGSADQQAGFWDPYQSIPISVPSFLDDFDVLEPLEPCDWDENFNLEMIDAEFEAFEQQDPSK
ncbi:hypothetical protein MHUMG1_06576 [Metarhizium humberi]|uniref:Uncharacterized protein n=1 Tax=Metarhizium humberi TaxID=2596975 RepID=A0A9P8M8A3_9HYPO|nr:hypothetical protein MHUMG1_06576 [Metarhizium humberi]